MGGTLFAWVILNLFVWLLETDEELTLHSNLWDDKLQMEKKKRNMFTCGAHLNQSQEEISYFAQQLKYFWVFTECLWF